MAEGITFGRRAFLAGAVAVLVGSTGRSFAASPQIYTGRLSSLAAGGYDVVAYFTDGRAVRGSPAHTHRWNGATWRFASAAAREAFAANPERYAPAYGGHCAWAAARGYRAAGDPLHWRIVDGRLFLNYNASVHRTWLTDPGGFIRSGDRNWPAMLAR